MKTTLQEMNIDIEQLRKLIGLRQLLLLLLVLNPLVAGIVSVAGANGCDCAVKISPGRILPQGYNHYLETPETQVKLEYPRGIILQNTTGDLLFNITTLSTKRAIEIYVPHEFGVTTNLTYIWSSITNDYRFISMSTLSDRHPIAPKWFRITVYNGTGNILPRSHLIRLFNVTAPGIVGRYFFKIFIDGSSIGAKNFPTLVVSADPNPAYISGTVLDCSSSFFRYKYGYEYEYMYAYGSPIQLRDSEGGKVVAEGVALDGRRVVGHAYFNASAAGRYTLYGLAPGSYNLTAYAAGYSPTPMKRLVHVRAGQSLDGVDLCIYASPKIEGVVWSKCGGIPHQWGPIATRVGPGFGAALIHLESGIFPGRDFIYSMRGVNTSDFFRYDTVADVWETRQPAPGPIGPGGSLAFDGVQYIYALQGGGSSSFWSYDVANDDWQTRFTTPSPVGEGGALSFNLNDGLVYALRGGNTSDFWRYVPTLNIWETLTSTLGKVGGGGSLVFNREDGYLYALRGMGTQDFWRYDPGPETWTNLQLIPVAVNGGGSLAFNSNDGLIYALVGGGKTNFTSYNASTNIWNSTLPDLTQVGSGGSLTFDSSNGLTYAFVGGGSPSFYAYGPDSWNMRADFPLLYPRPITVEILTPIDESLRLLQNFTDPALYNFLFRYDGATELDGHIPQDGSGYVSGIGLGAYKVRVWVNEYVQHEDFEVVLSNNIAVTRVEFDIHRTGKAEVTIHFKDFIQGQPTLVIPGKIMKVEFYDRDAILRGQNSTIVTSGSTSSTLMVTGFVGTLRDYGLPQGTYDVRVTIEGFYQPVDFRITISDCSSISQASLDVVKTGSLLLTIRSVNSQSPPQPQNWRYPGSPIRVEIRDQYGAIIYKTAFSRQITSASSADLFVNDVRKGIYTIHVFTFGYFQESPYVISIMDGIAIDTIVNLVVGSAIDLYILIEKEDLPAAIDTYKFSSQVPIRVEVYDAIDQFVAANATHIPSGGTTDSFRLAGFRRYAGDASWRWNNYYDTTDSTLQRDYGLRPGPHRVVVYLPGFSQRNVLTMVTLPEGGSSSLTLRLNRLSHLFGGVTSLNMFGELVPLNWAIIDAIGSETRDFTPTLDGPYETWLEEGRYLVICSLSGYDASTKEAYLSKGSDVQVDFRLRYIAINISEFGDTLSYVSAILAVAFVANIFLIKKLRMSRKSIDGTLAFYLEYLEIMNTLKT